jgi:hypothetical protein
MARGGAGADLTLNIRLRPSGYGVTGRIVIEKYIQQADRINRKGSKSTKLEPKKLFSLCDPGILVVKAIDRCRAGGYVYFIFGYG